MDVNFNWVLEALDGDRELLNEIINDVLDDRYQKDFIDNMEPYIEAGDFHKLSMHIHKFKGSIAIFNIESINHTLNQMNEHCQNGNLPAIEKSYKTLKIQFNELKRCLTVYKNSVQK